MPEPSQPEPADSLAGEGSSQSPSLSEGLAITLPSIHLRSPRNESLPEAPPLAPSSPGLPIGPTRRYHLLGELARGGMGSVLRGRDEHLGRDVAVKVLLQEHQDQPELLRRFVEEAQITGQLQHPGVIPVYELGQLADQRPYFAMKLVKGQTLADLLAGRKQRGGDTEDRPRFLKVFEQVCQTVAYAHSRGVIHRDLKPSNVMVGSFDEVLVMDWGLAKLIVPPEASTDTSMGPARAATVIRTVRAEAEQDSQTQSGSVLGTPAYMPPEQALGEVERLDARADVFSLGALLCEVLTGEPPYTGSNAAQVHRRAVRADLADALARLDACGADGELIGLARRCLAAEPDDRPADAAAVARELTAYRESVEARLQQARLAEAEARARAAEERKRRRLAVTLAASILCTVLLVGGGGVWLAREKAVRQARAARQAESSLALALSRRDQALEKNDPVTWAEARSLVDRAQELLAEAPGETALAERVNVLRCELEAVDNDRRLLERLEQTWLQRAEVDVGAAGFAREQALREYRQAFADHALLAQQTTESEAKAWLQRRPGPLREQILAGLDAWLGLARGVKGAESGWLFAVLQAADADSERRALRDILARDDLPAAERLVTGEGLARQQPQTILLLADYFQYRSLDRTVDLLRAAQERFAGDFWINYALARALAERASFTALGAADYEEPVRFYTAALALRPNNVQAELALATALGRRGRLREGLAACRKAVARQPNFAPGQTTLASLLMEQGQIEAAEAAYHEALRLKPDDPVALGNLALLLWGQGRYDEAALTFRRANQVQAHPHLLINLGTVLWRKGRLPEAIDAFGQAVRLQPNLGVAPLAHRLMTLLEAGHYKEAEALCQGAIDRQPSNPLSRLALAVCLLTQARFAEAQPVLRRYQELERQAPGYNHMLPPLFLRETEQLLALEPDLSLYLEGKRQPRDREQRGLVLFLCWVKKRYRGAAQLQAAALTADPKLADDVAAEAGYDVARFAALVAAGKGEDARSLDEAQRRQWRQQAVKWLRLQLAGWSRQLEGSAPLDRAVAVERLRWWQQEPVLAVIREPAALAGLPADEQQACRQLWAEVAALIQRHS